MGMILKFLNSINKIAQRSTVQCSVFFLLVKSPITRSTPNPLHSLIIWFFNFAEVHQAWFYLRKSQKRERWRWNVRIYFSLRFSKTFSPERTWKWNFSFSIQLSSLSMSVWEKIPIHDGDAGLSAKSFQQILESQSFFIMTARIFFFSLSLSTVFNSLTFF